MACRTDGGLDRTRGRRVALGVVGGLISLLASGCLNPELVNRAMGTLYPVAPGDTPFLLVRVVNQTPATVDFVVTYDDGSDQDQTVRFTDLTPEVGEDGILLPWPVFRLALGDLDDTAAGSITATFTDGLTVQVPFGRPALQAGTDYERGDTIIFNLTEDSRSSPFIRVSAAKIRGETQQGPFSRAETFETVELLLLQAALGVGQE